MKLMFFVIIFVAVFFGGVALQPVLVTSGLLDTMVRDGVKDSIESDEKKPLYWVAPMDKNYRRDKPGQSPMGMDLVPVYEENRPGADEGTVAITPTVENNLGVRSSMVKKGSFDLMINTVGYVALDEDQLTHLHSRVDGWIDLLNVKSVGAYFKKGDTLYELYSPSLVNAQEEFLAAQRSGNNMLEKASRSRLLSLGITSSQIARLTKRRKVDQRIKVVAERDGFVTKLNVRQGMFIKPSTEVMSIGTLDTVWVIGEVFERQASWVKQGQTVEMSNEAIPDRTWSGSVDYLYPVLDNKTRTLQVRIRINNADHLLKPNMFANLSLSVPVADDTLSIPREALIRGGRYNRVVLALGEGKFKSVMVEVGVQAGKRVQVVGGLMEGDRVVTSAQFLIDSESNIDADIARMEERGVNEADVDNSASKQVSATGTVKQLIPSMAMITIVHDPIDEWEWPVMSMSFTLVEPDQVPTVNPGDRIKFELHETDDGDYKVSDIEHLTPK